MGGGAAGDIREILKHPVTNVTYVELDPMLIAAARAHLPQEDAAVLEDPRVTVLLIDGRQYVGRSAGLARAAADRASQTVSLFDVVILDLPEPSTGALNRFYTYEFFSEVQAILNPDGIFSLGLPSAENYWSPELAQRNGSVYHTLRAVFPEVLVLPGEHNFFLASEGALVSGPSMLTARLAERGIETLWVTPSYIEYVLTTERFAGVQAQLADVAGVRLNEDLMPISYYYDLALWLSRFYPHLRGAFDSASLISLWWIAIPLVILVATARICRGHSIAIAIASIGLAEMALEVVILFAFQVLHGTIFASVSLIVTAFMAGLALGGAVSNRVLAGRLAAHNQPPQSRARTLKRLLIAVQAAVAVYCGLFPLILGSPIAASPLGFPLLALLAGVLTGMAFPLAVALLREHADRAAGMLYGVDLVGGCLGAMLTSVLLVPILGIPQTCAAIALVGLAGLLALV